MSEKKPLPFLVVAAAPQPADEPSPEIKELFQRDFGGSMRAMPSVVLAARFSQEICAQERTPSDITRILTDMIDAIRAEYRAEGDISEKICKDCDAITTWRVEVLNGGVMVERCTNCGKLTA
jgi:hypothetical protein